MNKEELKFIKNMFPKEHPKITDSIVKLLSVGKLPYYGELALFINFYQVKNNPQIPTAGVNVSAKGMNFYYNPEFIDGLTQPQVNFLLLHEEFHLLFDHVKRSVGFDHKLSNIAQDMIINQIIHDEIMLSQKMGEGKDPFVAIPQDMLEHNSALFIPKEYKGEPIFEMLYEWLAEKRREWRKENESKISEMKKDASNCQNCGKDINKDPKEEGENKEGEGEGNDKCEGGKGGEGSEGGEGSGGEQDGGEQGDQDGEGGGEGGEGSDGEGSGSGGKGSGEQDSDGSGPSKGGKKCPHCGHEQEQMSKQGKGGKDSDGKPDYGKYGQNDVDCYSLESVLEGSEREEQVTLDAHLGDQVPEEFKREIVQDAMARLKNRGLQQGDVETIINKLRKKKKDYLREIKRTMSSHVFGSIKSKTIVRPNRRGIKGLKGHKKYRNEINCILDTSGSMGGEFEKVLSYIFQNDIEINLLQIDTGIQDVIKIKNKRDLEKMRIKGLGGTVLQPAIDYIADKSSKEKLYHLNTVILTDGWTDSLNFKHIRTKTLILSTAQKCPITYDNGRVKQIENIGKDD